MTVVLGRSCPQHDVVEFCQSKGISLTAYSPLGSDNSPLLKNEVVNRIATKYGVSAANVLISFQANKPLHTGELYCTSGPQYLANLLPL